MLSRKEGYKEREVFAVSPTVALTGICHGSEETRGMNAVCCRKKLMPDKRRRDDLVETNSSMVET